MMRYDRKNQLVLQTSNLEKGFAGFLCCTNVCAIDASTYQLKGYKMTHTNNLFRKLTIGVLLTLIASLFMAQSFFPAPISAQEPGGKDYKWPILKERDFQLFMKQFESPDSDPDEFFKQENITREYYEAISKKIAYNVILEASGEDKEAVKELASELGESVVFNRQEKAIYAKYKQRILKNMEDNWD